jgi:2-methylcitrate dehydratase PrpD
MDVCDRPNPSSVYEAKFSMHHCVAAALSGRVDFESFEAPARERLASVRARVLPRVSDIYQRAYPIAWGSAVRVTMSDGRTIEQRREHAKGDPEAALSRDELIAKARMLLVYGRVPEPNAIIDGILALADDAPLPSISFKQPSTEKDTSWRTDHST